MYSTKTIYKYHTAHLLAYLYILSYFMQSSYIHIYIHMQPLTFFTDLYPIIAA